LGGQNAYGFFEPCGGCHHFESCARVLLEGFESLLVMMALALRKYACGGARDPAVRF
jgi:hypothetical protein